MAHRKILKIFSWTRFTPIVAIVCSILGSLLMFYIGAKKIISAIWDYFWKYEPKIPMLSAEKIRHLSYEDIAIARVIESLDAFLIALILLFFASGIFILFIVGKQEAVEIEALGFPVWIIPEDLGMLKKTLGVTILVILFVLFTRIVWLHLDKLTWDILVLPGAILLLAAALRLTEF